jgi:NAD(P)-dependent dehydrogenase (short-subunit alcohol dehydrogenase family)
MRHRTILTDSWFMRIEGSVGLVTGADRGIGAAFARQLIARGAAKVYAAGRHSDLVTSSDLTPVELDITDAGRVAEVAARCPDVTVLVNNAGVMHASDFLDPPNLDAARSEMEVNYFGTLNMCRAFAPVLIANGGGAIINMLSVGSFYTNPFDASYGASKAAALSLTNGVRIELDRHGTQVLAIHASFVDTEMAAGTSEAKVSPESVAQQAFDALERGDIEVLVDDRTRFVKESLSRDHELIYPPVQEFWNSLFKT